jgi:hypothetical protein
MATIVPNDSAPADLSTVSLANEVLDLSGGSVESEDREVLAAAEVHPWLAVEYPEVEANEAEAVRVESVRYEDDALSAPNSVAFDPDEVRAVEDAKREVALGRTALEAGLDQGEPVVEGGVAYTLAADEDRTENVETESAPAAPEGEANAYGVYSEENKA